MLMRERELETTSSQTGIAVRLLIVLGIVLASILAAPRHKWTRLIHRRDGRFTARRV